MIYYPGTRTWTGYLEGTNSNILVGSRIHDVIVRVRNTLCAAPANIRLFAVGSLLNLVK